MHEAIYNSQLNLSEYYPSHLFKNLIRVFPRLNNIVQKNNSIQQPVYIEKFLFYQMILEKIKNYFELSESFVISESIDIIIKDIKNKKKINLNKTALPLIDKYKISNNFKYISSNDNSEDLTNKLIKYNEISSRNYNRYNSCLYNKSSNINKTETKRLSKSNKFILTKKDKKDRVIFPYIGN